MLFRIILIEITLMISLLGIAVGLANCAHQPETQARFQVATDPNPAILQAQNEGAQIHAATELEQAQAMAQDSQTAAQLQQYDRADRLAQEARAMAELALAKTRLFHSRDEFGKLMGALP